MSDNGKSLAIYKGQQRIKALEQALEDIANPLAKLERDAIKSGGELSPLAFQAANDVEIIKGWARKALSR